MKKWLQILIAVAMIVLTIIPFLVIYESLSTAIPALPYFVTPNWFIPIGFLNIALIVVLAFFIKDDDK